MNSHAIVPIETWAYSGLDLAMRGMSVDVGHLAEALIYYDRVSLNVSNQAQFADVLSWFVDQGEFETLLSLVTDGTLNVYEYSFLTAPIQREDDGPLILMNMQEEGQVQANSFEMRFLYHQKVDAVIADKKKRRRLYQAFRGRVTEVKAEAFAESIEVARTDFADGRRSALVMQAFIDNLYRTKNLGRPPQVVCKVVSTPEGHHQTTYNLDFKEIEKLVGRNLWHRASPITGNAMSCRFLQSASDLGCDLFLPQPMSVLVGDKLFESARACNKPGSIIESLEASVEFPDVRALVNEGRISIKEVLYLRGKSKRFRDWLQSEASRDRDALIAYHHEVARDSGYQTAGRKTLGMFGFLAGPAVGAAIGAGLGPAGAAVGAAVGGALTWATDIGMRMENWKPVMFGNWYRTKIEELDAGG